MDKGPKALAGCPGEFSTEGLDGLRERLQEYYKLGARFAKWRAVIDIGDCIPTSKAIHVNAFQLASYASLCQEQGIVPIVEPEVLMDGAHSIEKCYEVTAKVLRAVFQELYEHGVALDGMVLKPNMVIAGQKCSVQASPQKVAEMTVKCFKEVVPADVSSRERIYTYICIYVCVCVDVMMSRERFLSGWGNFFRLFFSLSFLVLYYICISVTPLNSCALIFLLYFISRLLVLCSFLVARVRMSRLCT